MNETELKTGGEMELSEKFKKIKESNKVNFGILNKH